MASTETTRTAGGPAGAAADRKSWPLRPAPLGPTIALSSAISIGLFMAIAPVAWKVVPLTDLPEPLPDHHQDAETLLFVLAFVVLMPVGIWAGSWAAARVVNAADDSAVSALAAGLTVLLALVLIAGRLSSGAVLAAGSGLCLVAVGAMVGSPAGRRGDLAGRFARYGPAMWAIAAVVAWASAFAFTTIASISWPVLAIGVVLIAVFLAGEGRIKLPPPGRLGLFADAAMVVLLLLAVPNLVVLGAGGSAEGAVQTTIIQFHQNFFLGPANQVLAGDAMLVETLSQYGVGSIYFLAGLFSFIPIGNGTLGLIEGTLSALMFLGAWAVMRIAGVPRLFAGLTMTVAVITLVYGLQYPLGGLLQHGAIRFGLPVGVVLGAVAESRWPSAATPARLLQLATVAVASIWALEAFAYTLLTALAVVAVVVFIAPVGCRRGELVRRLGQLLAACLLAHVALALATLAAAGELPNWGWYLNTLREFLFGQIGDLTYDFSPWSPGPAVGAVYLTSVTALSLLLWRRPDVVACQRTLLIAIAGMTAFGIALFSYIVNRGADHIVPYVCLPAVTLGALWLTLLRRPVLAVSAAGRRAGWALGLGLSALLVAVAASSVEERFDQSALALVRPGGAGLQNSLDRLWSRPPVRPAAAEGQQLLETYMPGQQRSSVLTSADLAVEILLRSERGSAVPLGDPWEDSFVPDNHLGPLGEYVDALAAGDRILIDQPARDAFEFYRQETERDPLETPAGGVTLIPSGLATLQEWTLKEIGKRWNLSPILRTPGGLVVVELEPR